MNIKKKRYLILPAVAAFCIMQACFAKQVEVSRNAPFYQTGMEDIDQIRSEIDSIPTTKENAKSRHAALSRWWRFLWRQGLNMDSFDATANALLVGGDYDTRKIEAINAGFRILEKLAANPLHIPRVTASSSDKGSVSQLTKTNWPFYHGVDSAQTGYSPDVGPMEGKLAWRFPQSFKYDAVPVLEGGKIYLSSPGVDVMGFCLDEITGAVEWRVRQYGTTFYGSPKSKLSPTVTKDNVIFKAGKNRQVIRRDTGAIVDGAALEGVPEVDQELVIALAGPNGFWLEDANTGKMVRGYEVEQELLETPVLYEGKIFASCKDGTIYAYSASSWNLLWNAKVAAPLRGRLATGEGRLYAGSVDGRLFALDQNDGNLLWTYAIKKEEENSYQYYSLPLEYGNRVYVGTADSELLCVDAKSGNLAWNVEVSDWIRSCPVVVDDVVYAATLAGDLFAIKDQGSSARILGSVHLGDHAISIDLRGSANGILVANGGMMLISVSPDTLEVNWKHGILDGAWVDGEFIMADWTGGLQPSPTVVDGVLYCGGMDGFLFALDSETGREIWRFEAGGNISAAVTVAAGKVFFGEIDGEGDYYALDKDTGALVWQTKAFGNVWVSASYTPNGLFFGDMEGVMYGVDPETGTTIWSYDTAVDTAKENWRTLKKRGHGFPPGVYSVSVADSENVYVGSWSGYYFALNQRTGKVVWRTQTNNGNLYGGLPDSAALVLWKGYVYVQKAGSILAALSVEDGEIEWEWKVPVPFLQNGTIAAHGDKVFASYAHRVTSIPYNATIIAFEDVESGSKELWTYKGGGGLTAPVLVDGKLITGSSCDPFVVCLDSLDGSVIWRFFSGGEMRENVPAVYGNKVYVHSNAGWLYAIQ